MKNQIVVIEDDRDILDLIGYILADEGFNVAKFDRLIPLETLNPLDPLLILMDNRFIDGFGDSLCLSIKSSQLTKHIPVILVSASRDLEQVAEKCLADGYLPKPFDLQDLLDIVKKYAFVQCAMN